MEESILTTIKKLLGISEDDTSFDVDVLVFINSAIMALTQLGIGPSEGFVVEDSTTSWGDFLGEGVIDLEAAKSYIYLKTKMLFDPPASSAVSDAYKTAMSEYEFRLNIQRDPN